VSCSAESQPRLDMEGDLHRELHQMGPTATALCKGNNKWVDLECKQCPQKERQLGRARRQIGLTSNKYLKVDSTYE
jgi:hypothetical protein